MNHACTSFYFKLKKSLSVGRISIRDIGMGVGCNGGLIVWAEIIKRRLRRIPLKVRAISAKIIY